jgi:hypothetical protein
VDIGIVALILIMNFLSVGINTFRVVAEDNNDHLFPLVSGLGVTVWATVVLKKKWGNLQHDRVR